MTPPNRIESNVLFYAWQYFSKFVLFEKYAYTNIVQKPFLHYVLRTRAMFFYYGLSLWAMVDDICLDNSYQIMSVFELATQRTPKMFCIYIGLLCLLWKKCLRYSFTQYTTPPTQKFKLFMERTICFGPFGLPNNRSWVFFKNFTKETKPEVHEPYHHKTGLLFFCSSGYQWLLLSNDLLPCSMAFSPTDSSLFYLKIA